MAKNIEDHIVSGRADLSKLVISSTVSAYKVCEQSFRNFSRTLLLVQSRKWDFPSPRLLVAGSYDRKIGWANFDPQRNSSSNRDEDSRHFLTVYVQEEHSNDYFILSLQVRYTHPFLNVLFDISIALKYVVNTQVFQLECLSFLT